MTEPYVLWAKDGRVVTLTINRPESRNAVRRPEDCDAFAAAFARAHADPDVSVVILTGAGSAFCSGGDLKSIKERNGIGPLATAADTRVNYERGVHAMIKALYGAECATIAAINGPAIGLGLDIALACDVRVAGRAAKLASSFIKLGIVPGDGGAWILQNIAGYPAAAELALTGDTIDADEARMRGLVSRVVDDAALMDEARALAARIAANPPRSVRLVKRLLREAQHQRLADIMALSSAYQALAHETADHREAVAAFLDKRRPNFTGE